MNRCFAARLPLTTGLLPAGRLGAPDGVGHGHNGQGRDFNRPAIADFLGNTAIKGAGGQLIDPSQTPKF